MIKQAFNSCKCQQVPASAAVARLPVLATAVCYCTPPVGGRQLRQLHGSSIGSCTAVAGNALASADKGALAELINYKGGTCGAFLASDYELRDHMAIEARHIWRRRERAALAATAKGALNEIGGNV